MRTILAILLLTFPILAATQPIRIVVPFAPGGAVDTMTRVIAASMEVPTVVENLPGANGMVGSIAVKNAKPDGKTILMATGASHAAIYATKKDLPYDAISDFTPITDIGRFTNYLLVPANLPAQNLREIVAYAKDNPRAVNFATSNLSSLAWSAHLRNTFGISTVDVPYKGEPPALADLMSGRIHLMVATSTVALPAVKEGRVRAILALQPHHSRALPTVQTLTEVGLAAPTVAWVAVVGPAGMDREAIATLNSMLNKALRAPRVREVAEQQEFTLSGSSSAGLRHFMLGQIVDTTKALLDAGVRPE